MSPTAATDLRTAVEELDRRFRTVAERLHDQPRSDLDPIAVMEAQRSLDRFSFLVRSLIGELPALR